MTLDTRGFSCPIPVIMVQQEVKRTHPEALEVLTDNEAARGNVTRFAINRGYSVTEERTPDGDTRLTLKR